jgi:hypothetical protein
MISNYLEKDNRTPHKHTPYQTIHIKRIPYKRTPYQMIHIKRILTSTLLTKRSISSALLTKWSISSALLTKWSISCIKYVMHLHDHQNKVMLVTKSSILTNLSNDANDIIHIPATYESATCLWWRRVTRF